MTECLPLSLASLYCSSIATPEPAFLTSIAVIDCRSSQRDFSNDDYDVDDYDVEPLDDDVWSALDDVYA